MSRSPVGPEKKKINLVNKYGEQVLIDLQKFEDGKYIHLQEIGIKYGVTREAVRQWVNTIYGFGVYDNPKRCKLSYEISCKFHPSNKVAYFSGGPQLKGAIIEKEFYYKCLEKGLDIKPSVCISFDFIVNDKLVDVKSALLPRRTSKRSKTLYYHYNLTEKQSKESDFIACHHPMYNCFFILPKYYFLNKKSIYIPATKSNYRSSKKQIWGYKDAFNLFI